MSSKTQKPQNKNPTKQDNTDKSDVQKKALIASLSNGCTVGHACEGAKISRDTFYRWYKEGAAFAKRVESAKVCRVVVAEDCLFAKVKDGNMTAIIFFLCNEAKGKWESVNKIEHSVDPDHPLSFTFNGVKCIAGCKVKKGVNDSDKRL